MSGKILFLISSTAASPVHELIREQTASSSSADGIFTQGAPLADHRFPFHCVVLDTGKHAEKNGVIDSIGYPDMLRMIFESDSIVSCC